MANSIKAVLFDKDGTLLDFDANWAPVQVEAAHLASGGNPDVADELLRIAGMDPASRKTSAGSLFAAGNSSEIAMAWITAGAPFVPAQLTVELDRLFTENMRRAIVLPGVPEALNALSRAGLKLGIASSDSEAAIRAFVKGCGLAGHFDFLAGYDSGHGPKPEPGMINGFAAELGIPSSAIAMVGDNTHDLEMARTAGAGLSVGVLSGTATRADLACLADVILDSVADLPGTLIATN